MQYTKGVDTSSEHKRDWMTSQMTQTLVAALHRPDNTNPTT